jgi:hypothetical protein
MTRRDLLVAFAAQTRQPEICIYGASAAGITAAIQARKMGHSVLLLEPSRHLGGITVEGLGSSDIDNHWFRNSPALGGLGAEFYRRIGAAYGNSEPVYKFESSVAEKVILAWLKEHQVPYLLNAQLRSATKQGPRLTHLTLTSGQRIAATQFIDASIEGDLLHAAACRTIIGRESNAQYNETKNGIRAENTYRNFEVHVDPYWRPGVPSSGVLPTIQNEPLGTPGAADHRLQGYCFRMCLTKNPANRIPFQKPPGFDRRQYEIYYRYVQAGGQLFRPIANLPNGKTDQGSWHDLSANLYGMNYAYPAGSPAVRQRIYAEHLHFTQGLVYLLSTDPTLSPQWQGWGVCADEFTDNAGWPRQFYVRDARRLASDYVITEHHTRRSNQPAVSDPVAIACWPPDTHHVRRIIKDGAAYNEGFVFGGDDWGAFPISYRSLLPRPADCTNLLTPTCLSSTHVAYGAIRLEWTFFLLGQAAATAASQALAARLPVQDLPYAPLAARLRADGQVLAMNPVPQPKA